MEMQVRKTSASWDPVFTFDWMADRYVDQTRRVSWGRYPFWTDQVARLVAEDHPAAVADVGSGPGELIRRLQKRLPSAQLTAVDISPKVLEHVPAGATRVVADLHDWAPAHPRLFDAAVLSFVLRDQPDPARSVQMVAGTLKQGGRLVILETHTPSGWRGAGFHLYFHQVLPRWGARVLTPDWPGRPEEAPYYWLSESHRRWHQGEQLADWLQAAGLDHIERHTGPEDVIMLWSADAKA
jgi:demethylmenaquinone methyltransferase/2-methoxy-6-polyprenyl-1,4-benzoquinol methylase